MIDKDKLYTKKEASECLGISVYSINAAIRIKRLVVEPREPGQKSYKNTTIRDGMFCGESRKSKLLITRLLTEYYLNAIE